jgi:O-succinylbenzoic acid--CoA ligase
MDLNEFIADWQSESPTVLVHTSGSTGQPKPMLVEKRRMEVSARITCQYLGLKAGDTALLCLPLDYIAGKMMVVRAQTCGLRLICVKPCGHPLGCEVVSATCEAQPVVPIDFAAMVPMQVYNSLLVPVERERLRHIRHLIIGGGAIDEHLAQELRDFPNAVWSTYGMTETLSHIALRRLSGPEASEWYTPFEGVSVTLNADSCLIIDAPAVHEGALVTNDIAELSADGRFHILGRKDNVICSGGVKIQIEEVERLLRQHTSVPLLITKCKDGKFGEAVVMLTESSETDTLLQLSQRVLPRFWQPKHIFSVEKLPFTETGKPARMEAEFLASKKIPG